MLAKQGLGEGGAFNFKVLVSAASTGRSLKRPSLEPFLPTFLRVLPTNSG